MVYTVVNTSNEKEYDDTNTSGIDQEAATRTGGFWNLDLELQAIKTILTPTSDWSSKVYAVCKPEFFYHSTSRSVFQRLQALMAVSKTFELPTLEFVLSDSKLSPSIRDALRESFDGTDGTAPVSIVQSQGDFDILVQGLTSLSKTRALYNATFQAANELLESDDPTDLMKSVSDKLGVSLFNMEDEEELLSQITMGKGYNQAAEDSFNRIINGTFEEQKIKTGFLEFDERTGGFHRTNLVVLGANSGGGKCVVQTTKIPTSRGLLEIGDIHRKFAKGDGWSPLTKGTLDIHTRQGIKAVDGIFKGEGKTYCITTRWKDEFEGLKEHKLFCFDNKTREFGFKELSDLRDSDWILKTIGTNLFSHQTEMPYEDRRGDLPVYPKNLTSDLACLFGIIVAEGCRSDDICNNDLELLQFSKNCIESKFGMVCNIRPRSGSDKNFKILFPKSLSTYLSHFLGDVKSADRFIPKCVMQAPEEIQCAFLRGYYEGDGSIYKVNKGGEAGKDSHVWSLECTSLSKKLIYELKSLFENIGIYCWVDYKKAWAANGSDTQQEKTSYTLYVLRESYALFQQKIGFMSERKNTELLRCVDHCNKMIEDKNTNYFVSGLFNRIPNAPVIAYINRVFDLMKEQTLTVTQQTRWGTPITYAKPIGKYHIFYPNNFVLKILKDKNSYTSKYTAELIITSHLGYSTRNRETGEYVKVAPHIRDLVENDPILKEYRKQIKELCSQVWAQVESFEKKEDVVPVFDLSVPEHHEYAANGLMSHNSLMAVNLLIRQFRLGYNVCLCSYEMTDDEVMIRLLSNISEVDMNRMQNNKITPNETDQATSAWREFNLIGYEKENSYNIICPKTETTVPEIGFRVRSFKPDVLILDYINLLGSSTGSAEAQWQQLGNISREAKLLANKLNCVVILLAQIDDAYNLRYSKAIKDHANFVMGWIRDDEAIENEEISINQMKARNAPLYPFKLKTKFEIAQFRDLTQQDRVSWPTKDDLMMMEIQCQQVGLKLEPSVSKDFDKKKLSASAEKRNKAKPKAVENISQLGDSDELTIKPTTANLLFSEDDAMAMDFSAIKVTAGSDSLLIDNPLFEDTV